MAEYKIKKMTPQEKTKYTDPGKKFMKKVFPKHINQLGNVSRNSVNKNQPWESDKSNPGGISEDYKKELIDVHRKSSSDYDEQGNPRISGWDVGEKWLDVAVGIAATVQSKKLESKNKKYVSTIEGEYKHSKKSLESVKLHVKDAVDNAGRRSWQSPEAISDLRLLEYGRTSDLKDMANRLGIDQKTGKIIQETFKVGGKALKQVIKKAPYLGYLYTLWQAKNALGISYDYLKQEFIDK